MKRCESPNDSTLPLSVALGTIS